MLLYVNWNLCLSIIALEDEREFQGINCRLVSPFLQATKTLRESRGIAENKINKMHKLILGLIYYCSITPTCFGPLIEAIIRESKILECYKAFMAIYLNVVMWMYSRRVWLLWTFRLCIPQQAHATVDIPSVHPTASTRDCGHSVCASHSEHTRREYIHITTLKKIVIKAL
jgi:hypothetical protein